MHGNDKQSREHICRYILRPPFANHRLHTLSDGKVQLNFKRQWSDGTNATSLVTLASYESPLPADIQDEETPPEATPPAKRKSKYTP